MIREIFDISIEKNLIFRELFLSNSGLIMDDGDLIFMLEVTEKYCEINRLGKQVKKLSKI